MSNLIFKSFNLGNNLIDDLFFLFENHRFSKYKKVKSSLHLYSWPQIVLSNEKSDKDFIVFPDEIDDLRNREILFRDEKIKPKINKIIGFSIDLIGQYNGSDIYLFNLNIEKCANAFYKYYKNRNISGTGNLVDIINSLMEIVLIHETVHFLIDHQNKINYVDQDQVYYHEAIAQFFTNHLIQEHKLHCLIFEWLLNSQLKRYRVFKELNHFEFDDVVLGINNSCKMNIQSFDTLIYNLNSKRKNH